MLFFSFLECWRDVPNCANKLKGLKVHQRQSTIFSKMRQKLFFPIMYLNFNQNVNFCNFRVIMQSKSGFYARKFKYFIPANRRRLIASPPVVHAKFQPLSQKASFLARKFKFSSKVKFCSVCFGESGKFPIKCCVNIFQK